MSKAKELIEQVVNERRSRRSQAMKQRAHDKKWGTKTGLPAGSLSRLAYKFNGTGGEASKGSDVHRFSFSNESDAHDFANAVTSSSEMRRLEYKVKREPYQHHTYEDIWLVNISRP